MTQLAAAIAAREACEWEAHELATRAAARDEARSAARAMFASLSWHDRWLLEDHERHERARLALLEREAGTGGPVHARRATGRTECGLPMWHLITKNPGDVTCQNCRRVVEARRQRGAKAGRVGR